MVLAVGRGGGGHWGFALFAVLLNFSSHISVYLILKSCTAVSSSHMICVFYLFDQRYLVDKIFLRVVFGHFC